MDGSGIRGDEDELPTVDEGDAEEVIVLENNSVDPDANAPEKPDLDQVENAEMANAPETPAVDDSVLQFRKHTSETLAIDANPTDKTMIASGGQDDIAILWDIDNRTSLVELDGAGESVSSVKFSNDGNFLAIGSENGAISVLFLQGAQAPQGSLEGPTEAVTFLAWHPRGPVLLAGSDDKLAYMWNASRGLFMMAFAGHEDGVTAGFFTRDGKKVVTSSKDTSIRIWNPASGVTISRIQAGQAGIHNTFHGADIYCLDMGYQDTTLANIAASGCAAGNIYLSNVENGSVLAQLPGHDEAVESLAFSPPSFRPFLLASAGGDGKIRIRDMEAGAERCVFSHSGVVTKIKWHPQRPVLVSSSSEGTLCLWNALSGKQITELQGHTSFISDFCFVATAEFIASVSGDGTVRVFDIRSFV